MLLKMDGDDKRFTRVATKKGVDYMHCVVHL